jgi:hypothetical protein
MLGQVTGRVNKRIYFMWSICLWPNPAQRNIHLDRIMYAIGLTRPNITLGRIKSIPFVIYAVHSVRRGRELSLN